MTNFFSEIIRDENAHTLLLHALMKRNFELASRVINYLTDEKLSSEDISRLEFTTQAKIRTETGFEIPDLVAKSELYRIVIEVKIADAIPLTPAQTRCYENWFSKELIVSSNIPKCYFCLLVPSTWKHYREIPSGASTSSGVKIVSKVREWKSLIDDLTDIREDRRDPIITEVLDFFAWSFEMKKLNAEELHALKYWKPESYRAFRILESTVDKARKILDQKTPKSIKIEPDVTNIDTYIYHIVREAKYLFWFGIWTPEAEPDANPFYGPLCWGYTPDRYGWQAPRAYPEAGLEIQKDRVWSISPEAWSDAELLVREIVEIYNKYWALDNEVIPV